ncbi:MAG: DUF1684 domain-containing protein [Bacteroidales bacterium]|nr:DUF1684 domain-containing protein [Bacteroidales bacterium]
MTGKKMAIGLLLCCPLFFTNCSSPSGKSGETTYKERIMEWRSERLKNLKASDGWLNLAGLYWLDSGKNTIGSNSSNDIVFPEKAPDNLGNLYLSDNTIQFTTLKNTEVFHQDSLIQKIQMQSDAKGDPTVLSHGPLKWFVIKRGDQYGIRLRDLESPLLDEVTEIPAFPVSKEWRIKAKFEPYEEKKTMEVPNVLGGTNEVESPGVLKFEYRGETYILHPMGSRESLFLVFGDETNAEETYGGGRFLVAEAPDENNNTHIDFNKAYNPPCAFTPYATCPLPPRQNVLSFKVKAGEKAPDLDVPHH